METDWQNKCADISQRILCLHKLELFSDCEFIVSEKKIRCHKLLLAAASPVFEAMFYGSMSSQDNLSTSIHITDIDYETFKQMISYIYGDQLMITTYTNACFLYQASKKYMIQNLTKRCLNYLTEHIECDIVLQMYEFAKFHGEDALEKLCLKEIQVNTSSVINNDALMDANESTLNVILEMKRLNISSESELVRAVERWSIAEAEKRGCNNPRNVAKNLVQKLRFLTLTMEEFMSDLFHSKLLEVNEKLEILLRIVRPQLPPMANTLCEKKIKRKQCKVKCLATLDIWEIHEARCDGSEWLTSIFTTNSRIDLLGVKLHLQIDDTDDNYMENLMVKVSLANEQDHFTGGALWDMVRYNSKAEILFNEIVTLEPLKEYAIHVFLCSAGIYPLGKHSNLACDNQNVEIDFLSHSSWERSQPCNMTVLNAIIYADPLD